VSEPQERRWLAQDVLPALAIVPAGASAEDLFAQVCMDKHGVKKVENFEISTDGACPGDRPKDQQKNKKWIPPCAGTVTPSIHPFKKPDDWKKCYDETNQRRDYLN